MNKTFNLTEQQLNFISFMKWECDSRRELRDRLNNSIDKLYVENDKNNSNKIQYHSPKKMIEFLSLFSRHDHFKWYTHKWDQDGQTFESLLSNQKRYYVELSKMAFDNTEFPVNSRTYYQVWHFIDFNHDPTNSSTWRDNNGQLCNVGWHSIVGLHEQDPETPIENLLLTDGHQFKDYIRRFKASIEFRTDLDMEDRFNWVVKKTLNKYINGAVNIIYSENFRKIGRDLNIYCDVPAVVDAIGIICEWIVKYKVNGTNVKVSILAKEDSYELVILHENSYFSNINKLSNSSGDLDKLRNRLFSICDLTMSGDYIHNGESKSSIAVHVLENETTKEGKIFNQCRIESIDRHVGGVEYALRFYR